MSTDSTDPDDTPSLGGDDDGGFDDPSRRQVIKGAIGGTLVAANAYLFNNVRQVAADDGSSDPGLREQVTGQVMLNVNGRQRTATIADQERLTETLRNQLGLTGSKFGCDRAMCGACTVEVDGNPVYGCTYFTRDAVGTEITTIEGLESDGELHPLQESFVEGLGGQCGFCTPGMIMSAKSLLEENPDPSREEVKEALAGNLCRCGNYENEIDSVLAAAEEM
ncbi:hypothetical protein JCM30237_30180 [Halolamina litorea]|uniref:(2Fe-2S)-binding protein n=1 Tax=Halolamina litorea TaxID=1515593 RepID=A0ABD6BN02_9EURY|nr:(2Fe-2S)-binding protein [Halolamina litorea]